MPPALTVRDVEPMIVRRQTTVIPTSIPTYASACSGSSRYSSACSCVGVTGGITSAPTPATATVITSSIVESNPTVNVFPTVTVIQYDTTDDRTCVEAPNEETITPVPLAECVPIIYAYSFSLSTFTQGEFSSSDCYVNFYSDTQCSMGETGPYALNSVLENQVCFNAVAIYSVILSCFCLAPPVKI